MIPLVEAALPTIAIVNFCVAAVVLVGLAKAATARPLQQLPDARQNAAELALEWFVAQAQRIAPGHVRLVAPFLATLFLLILASNLLALLPIPLLGIPPTAYFSVPLALAVIAVLGVIVLQARIEGVWRALRHRAWPNPLQLVSDASHTLSLSLRLYGNIGGEYLVAQLATQAAPYGIPIVIHTLGLVPAVLQPMVFTLLTADFLATAVTEESPPTRSAEQMLRPTEGSSPAPPEGGA